MKVAYYVKKRSLQGDAHIAGLLSKLSEGGSELYDLSVTGALAEDTDVLLSFGGDGTLLSAAGPAAVAGVPVLGVNMGRLGFLSACTPDEVADVLLAGQFAVEEREMLSVSTDCPGVPDGVPFALNEVTVYRAGAAMLGVDVSVNGVLLPTYWADGLLVSTSSGSTAYNLSAGGPICTPDTRVLIITPIASHNLNVRPLIVPESAAVSLSFRSRQSSVILSLDNRNFTIPVTTGVEVASAPLRLKMVSLGKSGFINALRSRLLWGQDVRNSREKQ